MILEEPTPTPNEIETLTDKEIFTKIWSSPRIVFRYINETKYEKYFYGVVALIGISAAFEQATSKSYGDNIPLIGLVALCIVLGGLLGWIGTYIYAALVSWTGGWLDGKAHTESIFRISAYAMIPSIAALALLIPKIALFGNGVFQSEFDVFSQGIIPTLAYLGLAGIEFILSIWSLVLLVIGISEIQKLSIGYAILNVILPILIFAVPIAIMMVFFA